MPRRKVSRPIKEIYVKFNRIIKYFQKNDKIFCAEFEMNKTTWNFKQNFISLRMLFVYFHIWILFLLQIWQTLYPVRRIYGSRSSVSIWSGPVWSSVVCKVQRVVSISKISCPSANLQIILQWEFPSWSRD